MKFFFFLFFSTPLFATFVLNPVDPKDFSAGIFCKNEGWFSLRTGYVTEYVYKASCKQEFLKEGEEKKETADTSMLNYFGILTLNICSRVDLYGFGGSFRMEIDDQIFPKREPAWGVGAKVLLINHGCFALSIDGKVLYSEQKPTYFLVDQQLAPLVTKLHFDYQEEQLSVAIAYRTSYFVPYIGFTYFDCKLTPSTVKGYGELPNMDYVFPFEFQTFVSKKNWGLVLGASLFACNKVSINLEARHFDQSSVNGSIQVQF